MTTTPEITAQAAESTLVVKPAGRTLGVAAGLSALFACLMLAGQPAAPKASAATAPVATAVVQTTTPFGDTSVPAARNDSNVLPDEPIATF